MSRILVADDEAEVRRVIRTVLENQGHEVDESADGDSTYEAAVADVPDLIMLDILMPGMNGFEVLQKLKANPATKDVPVVVVTSLNHAQDEHRAMQGGAADFISKPWAPGELEGRVQTVLSDRGVAAPEVDKSKQSNSGSDKTPSAAAVGELLYNPAEGNPAISTGSDPMDRALLGGLPLGSLTLLEGASGTGKTVLCQHLAFGALLAELGVAYYVQGKSAEELVAQMESLGLEVAPNLKEGQFLIYPLTEFKSPNKEPGSDLEMLKQHMLDLPWDMKVIVVDSLTNMVSNAGTDLSVKFLMKCNELCRWGKSVVIALHTASFDPNLRTRLQGLFNNHLSLRIEGTPRGLQMKTMNVMDVAKVHNSSPKRQTSVYFEVDPELGRSMNMSIKVLPIFKIKT